MKIIRVCMHRRVTYRTGQTHILCIHEEHIYNIYIFTTTQTILKKSSNLETNADRVLEHIHKKLICHQSHQMDQPQSGFQILSLGVDSVVVKIVVAQYTHRCKLYSRQSVTICMKCICTDNMKKNSRIYTEAEYMNILFR